MDLLKREQAPILPQAWDAIDREARQVLTLNLAGRKLVDFKGPHGWEFAAVNRGRLELLATQVVPEVSVGVRLVQPLIEVRTPIRLDIMELDSVARGASDPDLDPVRHAAERIAKVEDGAIFHGYKDAGMAGMLDSSPHARLRLPTAPEGFPAVVTQAKEVLRQSGVDGPYALALGPGPYNLVATATEQGYPLKKHVEQLLDRPIVWAPALRGGVLLSIRGGDFELWVGQDLSVGYADRDKHQVELYLTESFAFRVLVPAAAVGLDPA